MRGNAPDRLKARAKQFIETVAVHDATVQAVLDDPVIRLMVLVDTVRSRTRLQNTRIDWVQPDTQITVTLQIGGDGDGLYDGLLHELILHVVPAALKHAAAIAVGTAPAYPTTDALIEAEEAQEHRSRPAWRRMADLAVALGIGGLLDAVVMDACAHGKAIARDVVAHLLAQGSIDQEGADEYLETINE
ncbi:hypothetical protein [Streptomyces zhihengii]|uniref:hypothetical protein n=1 Tax=Streptomyces zhihengii TaxID=1818004 RepID=UPI0033A57C35